MLIAVIGLLTLICLAIALRPLTILFHELGHAIPALLLTRQPVTIYLGSYGEERGSIRLSAGPISIWFKYNPFSWIMGLCVPHAKAVSAPKQIIYTLCGPFASIIIAVVSAYFAFSYDGHGAIKLILIVFLGCALFDLIVNLIPNNTPIHLPDGEITFNDGYQLRELFRYMKLPAEYLKALDLYHEKKYEESYSIVKDLATAKRSKTPVLRLAVAAALSTRRYKEALSLYGNIRPRIKLDSDDHGQLGIIYGFLDEKENSLRAFDKSLELNPENIYSLNNRGYLLVLWERFDEAIADLEKAIALNEEYSYSYNNLGLAMLKRGQAEEGLAYINKSLELEPDNSYAIRNLGIYHLHHGRPQQALEYFFKAKELDENTHLIDTLIQQTRETVTNTSIQNSFPQLQTPRT